MNHGTLEAARMRHPAGSRLAGVGGCVPRRESIPTPRAALRLLPAPVPACADAAAVHRGPSVARSRPVVRLTRRGRALFFVLALGLVFGVGLAFGARAVGADSKARPANAATHPHRVVVVQPGQTLWGIARAAEPDADLRSSVDRIIELNALPGPALDAGRRLLLP
jgi:hypothetical protein